jgi:hypothetical protein
MPITLEAAKKEVQRTRRKRRRDAGNYATTRKIHHPSADYRVPEYFADHLEPADPPWIDHEKRRQTRLSPRGYEGLSKPFYECGCGDCSDAVDPLADESEPFRDDFKAADVCPDPRPVTVGKARDIYLAYQKAAWDDPERTSRLEHTQNRNGRMLGAERNILSEMEDPTLIFLSLRLSPVEERHGARRWIPPSILGDRLGAAWQNVRGVLRYQLREYDSEYAAITAMTTSAATPHRHAAIYVDDPDDEIDISVAESAVRSHLNNCEGAEPEDHPVEPDQSDAGMVFYDVPKAEQVPEETLIDVFHARGEQSFSLPSVPLYYVSIQQPHWALKNVYDGTSDIHADSIHVDGAAIAWALSWREYSHSEGFADDGHSE